MKAPIRLSTIWVAIAMVSCCPLSKEVKTISSLPGETIFYGRIVDIQGLPIGGSTVTLRKGRYERKAITDKQGYFMITEIPAGKEYELILSKQGDFTVRSKVDMPSCSRVQMNLVQGEDNVSGMHIIRKMSDYSTCGSSRVYSNDPVTGEFIIQ